MNTQLYKGYTLKNSAVSRIEVYRGRKFIAWFISMDQAKRMIDEVVL